MKGVAIRRWMFFVWLLLPLAAAAYHKGPGQEALQLDQAAERMIETDALRREGDNEGAMAALEEALRMLPEDQVALRRRILIERAKLQLDSGLLTPAREGLTSLVGELDADPAAEASLCREAQSALAHSRFYMAWLMRLEGRSRGEWEPEIESARQTYSHLAGTAQNHAEAVGHQKDLEAAVKLSRMDLGDLQGLPLPNQ